MASRLEKPLSQSLAGIYPSTRGGEKHIADVKTESGVVLEFQHSHLHREERDARENFYPKMVWIVDGRRRKRDRARFFASLDAGIVVNREPRIVSVLWKEGALLRDWEASRVPVYFDFGDSEPGDTPRFETPILWRLNPCGPNGMAYLSPVQKALFLHVHLEGLSGRRCGFRRGRRSTANKYSGDNDGR
jgi:competence protein CoiA